MHPLNLLDTDSVTFFMGMAAWLLLLLGSGSAQAQQPHPAPPESETWYNWTTDGIRHYVYETGQARAPGDTVVVLHGGWGAEHSYLVEPLQPLANRYRLVLYDQRGSLRSPAPDSTLSLDRLVADLDDLRSALGLDQITLAAHSMGNALAYAYLDAHPDRVRGLVLIGAVPPAAFTGAPNMAFVRKVWPAADSSALREAHGAFFREARQRAHRIIEREGLLPDSLQDVPARDLDPYQVGDDRARTYAWRIFFTAVNTCNAENWRSMRGGQVFYNADVPRAVMSDRTYEARVRQFWPALRTFEGPVRVIMGTCDYVDLGPAVWPHIVERLPDAALQIVDGAGHSLWMDRPDAFREALGRALEAATAP